MTGPGGPSTAGTSGEKEKGRVRDDIVEVQPQVAGLEVSSILAARAADGEHGCREAVQIATEELHAGGAAAVHAGAGRVRGGRKQEQVPHSLRLDLKDQAPGNPLEAGQTAR